MFMNLLNNTIYVLGNGSSGRRGNWCRVLNVRRRGGLMWNFKRSQEWVYPNWTSANKGRGRVQILYILWERNNWMTPRGIEERVCGEYRDQSKTKWNFQGYSRKNHMEFLWLLLFYPGLSKGCHTISQNLQGWTLVLKSQI